MSFPLKQRTCENPNNCAALLATKQTAPKTGPFVSNGVEMKTKTSFGSSNIFKSQTLRLSMIVYLAYVEPFLSAEPLFGFEPVEPGASFPADAANHPGHCQASLVPSAAEEAAKVKAQTEAMAAKLAQARQEMEQLKAA